MAESAPRVLGGRYEVRSLIGRGGMAEVHLGFDKRLSRIVAIKTLRTDLAMDSVFQARFRREASPMVVECRFLTSSWNTLMGVR